MHGAWELGGRAKEGMTCSRLSVCLCVRVQGLGVGGQGSVGEVEQVGVRWIECRSFKWKTFSGILTLCFILVLPRVRSSHVRPKQGRAPRIGATSVSSAKEKQRHNERKKNNGSERDEMRKRRKRRKREREKERK